MAPTRSQLRDHFCGVPIGVHGLNLAVFVHFDDVDSFESNFLAAIARAFARPFDGRAVAGNEDRIFRQADAFEVLTNGSKKFPQTFATGNSRCADGIMRRAVFGKTIGESFRVHRANREKIVAHHARDSVRFRLCAHSSSELNRDPVSTISVKRWIKTAALKFMESVSPHADGADLARSCSIKTRRRIFPDNDLGICLMNSTSRIFLCGATRAATKSIISSPDVSCLVTTNALGTSPASSSRAGMTAASAIAGCVS